MKQTFVKAMILSLLAAPAVTAQDTGVNINTLTAPELPSLPVIDGDLSDSVWTNVPEVVVDGSGDSPAPTTPGDLDIVMKVAWDEESNALLFGFHIIDDVFINVLSRGSSLGGGGFNNERMELIINGSNTGNPAHGEDSEFHTQYTFDIPTTWDPQPGGINDLPVSTEFVQLPVFEAIDGSLIPPALPFDLNDQFVESAVQIRTTDPDAAEWLETPVEWTWEFKIAVFDELFSASAVGFDLNDPALQENGFLDFFEDGVNLRRALSENDVIGISPQQNDADLFAPSPEREHQVNTTNVPGNWNSSADLTGLILAAQASDVSDWELLN